MASSSGGVPNATTSGCHGVQRASPHTESLWDSSAVSPDEISSSPNESLSMSISDNVRLAEVMSNGPVPKFKYRKSETTCDPCPFRKATSLQPQPLPTGDTTEAGRKW